MTKEGDDADAAVAQAARRTNSRRELARNPRFEQISPHAGELDEAALEEGLGESPDDVLALLADLTAATDIKLRELARSVAARLFLDVGRRGPLRGRGISMLVSLPFTPDGGDLDIDQSMDGIAEAFGSGRAVEPERLRLRGWYRPAIAMCLMVDRSGSMGGKPLATSAVAAAAVACRSPRDYSVLAFARDVVVVKSQDVDKDAERVVTDLLTLRGFGTTDLTRALQTADGQLRRSRARRRITLLLSDCRATVDGDVAAAAGALDELLIIAPAGDSGRAEELASGVGARIATVGGPYEVAAAIAGLLDGG